MTLLYLRTITGVSVWTWIEPSVGVICSCLTTLGSLLKKIWLKGVHLLAAFRSVTTSARQDGGFGLESGIKSTGRAGSAHHTRWVDNVDFTPNHDLSNESTVATSKALPTSGRDDITLVGILVQRDVRVEQVSRSSSSKYFVY